MCRPCYPKLAFIRYILAIHVFGIHTSILRRDTIQRVYWFVSQFDLGELSDDEQPGVDREHKLQVLPAHNYEPSGI